MPRNARNSTIRTSGASASDACTACASAVCNPARPTVTASCSGASSSTKATSASSSTRATATDILKHKPYTVTTLDPAQERVDFWVVNDIHSRDSIFRLLIRTAPEEKPDFVCLNGDLATQIETRQTLWDACLASASEILTPAGIPLVAVRGNHENRGVCSGCWSDFFPTPTGETYYTFRRGPAFFLVLDGCEDKPDSDIRYYGLGDWDAYRQREAAWLKKVVESEEFRTAPCASS